MLDTFKGVEGTLPLFGEMVGTTAMLPTNPLRLVSVIVEVPDPPAVKLICVTLVDMLKSGVAGPAWTMAGGLPVGDASSPHFELVEAQYVVDGES